MYIRNPEKWYLRIYLQGSSGETDIENRLMDMGRREERVRCMERVGDGQEGLACCSPWDPKKSDKTE